MTTFTSINTNAAGQFGASVQRHPLGTEHGYRLSASTEAGVFLMWDMTMQQAELLYQRIGFVLGHAVTIRATIGNPIPAGRVKTKDQS